MIPEPIEAARHPNPSCIAASKGIPITPAIEKPRSIIARAVKNAVCLNPILPLLFESGDDRRSPGISNLNSIKLAPVCLRFNGIMNY
jgi:hypothetical protein